MTMTPALWLSRLAKLTALMNVSAEDREHDDQDDEAEDRGQRAEVAAADAGEVVVEARR